MTDSLATVERLAARLGRTFTNGSADLARAEEALWQSSTRARDVANQPDWDAGDVPDVVVDIVLSAAFRVFTNPQRYLSNQGGSFQGSLAQSDFATGDIFLAGELDTLRSFKPATALWVQPTSRGGGYMTAGQFVPVEGSSEPMPYYAGGWFSG